jgi:hypothetical protein
MRIVALTAVLTLAGCAGAPQGPTTPAANPVAATRPATPAPAQTSGATAPGGISPELYAQARQQGYRARVVKEQTIFCRNEAPLGSRITKDVCVSADQLENSVRQTELFREQMLRGQSCGKAACGGN